MTEREKKIKVLRDNIEYELRDYPNEHYVGVTFNYGILLMRSLRRGLEISSALQMRNVSKLCRSS